MQRKIRSFGALLALFFVSQTIGAFAQFNSDDWLNKAFVKPLPGKTKDGKAVVTDKSASVSALASFMKKGPFLSSGDVTHFSKNLESLVGFYFVINEGGGMELAGTTVVSDSKNIDIKDGLVFSAVVDRQFNAGVKHLPFLSLDMKKNDLAKLTIRSVVTVHGNTDANLAACNIPIKFLGDKNKEIFFITAATVTMISKKTYKVREQKGAGLISILSLNGRNYYSSAIDEREPVISVSPIKVSPIDPAYQHMCAKYNDAYKNVLVASLAPQKKVRAVRAMGVSVKRSKEQRALDDLKEQLSKVVKQADGKHSRSIGGRVLRVAQ